MQAQDVMTRDVIMVTPDASLEQAAQMMEDADIGVLPVTQEDRLVGMLTDRDIAIRAVARGKGPGAKVREVMTAAIRYCYCDQDIQDIADNMADIQIRRLPVLDRDKRLVGILSLGDLATSDDPDPAAEALCGISRPGPVAEIDPLA